MSFAACRVAPAFSSLKNPPDLAHARIYDRILERCAPILFDGKNFREENAGAGIAEMDMNLVGCLTDFLYHRWRVFRRSGRSSGVCHLHSTGFSVHFSNTSTETMSDKIKRMLKNEIQQM